MAPMARGRIAVLIADANGNLYGTTQLGGTYNEGTVFELSPPTATGGGEWTESILHSFSGTSGGDGAQPLAGLLMDTDSKLASFCISTARRTEVERMDGDGLPADASPG